jgi:hypothetical protein
VARRGRGISAGLVKQPASAKFLLTRRRPGR